MKVKEEADFAPSCSFSRNNLSLRSENPTLPGLLRLINISSLPSSFYKPLVNVILFFSYFFIAFWTTAKKNMVVLVILSVSPFIA